MADAEGISRDNILSSRFLRAVYQPIVEIETGVTAGYEALARWPGLAVTPEEVFALAARDGYLDVLDWTCHLEALRGALAVSLGRRPGLFVNSEPLSFADGPPAKLGPIAARAGRELRVIIEITERSLTDSPAKLLRACRWIRDLELGLALDDVGTVPESLALLPLIAPDIVKIDLRSTGARSPAERAHFVTAIAAYAERSGATIVAEGVETERDLAEARVLGATLGQGWYFGPPEPLPEHPPTARPGVFGTFRGPVAPPVATPTALLGRSGRAQVARKDQLVALSVLLERQAVDLRAPVIVLAAVQGSTRFSPSTSARYGVLSERSPLVVVFGARPAPGSDSGGHPGARFRTVALDADDPLAREWIVVVLGGHYAGALVARDLGDAGPDLERRFEFMLTHDRDVVLQAAASLLERVPTIPRPSQLPGSDPVGC